MIKLLKRWVCLWFFLSHCLFAQSKAMQLIGTVRDATTRKPVARATVSAPGDTAQQNEITDDNGFFQIRIQGVPVGEPVRIRVEKRGYEPSDSHYAASEKIPLEILLSRKTPPTHDSNNADAMQNQPNDLVFNAEFEELKAIDDFLGRKSEIERRETFDLLNMLHFNIELLKRSMAPQLVSREASDEIDNYFKGGNAIADVRLINPQSVNDRIEANPTPGRVWLINTSPKYLQSQDRLRKYCESPQLPSKVINALKEFETVVENNTYLMRNSLDESQLANPASILEDDDDRSSFFRSAEGHYWHQFAQLKPKADAVRDSIRLAMGMN